MTRIHIPLRILQLFIATMSASGFLGTSVLNMQRSSHLYSCRESTGFSNFDTQILKQRITMLRMQVLESEYKRPPNSELSPEDFIREMLRGLWDSSDPLPDSGFRLLLRASTKNWRNKIFDAVGAPQTVNEEVVAAALGDAISRPHNQYNILVAEAEDYIPFFPSEKVDYSDGKCWVECRFRGKNDDELLVATGWQLEKNEDGAWLVDRIDWQEFRDEYRPGVGREEWISVVG